MNNNLNNKSISSASEMVSNDAVNKANKKTNTNNKILKKIIDTGEKVVDITNNMEYNNPTDTTSNIVNNKTVKKTANKTAGKVSKKASVITKSNAEMIAENDTVITGATVKKEPAVTNAATKKAAVKKEPTATKKAAVKKEPTVTKKATVKKEPTVTKKPTIKTSDKAIDQVNNKINIQINNMSKTDNLTTEQQKNKKMIVVDERLYELGESLCMHVTTENKYNPIDTTGKMHICEIYEQAYNIVNITLHSFKWVMNIDELRKVTFENNLDSLLEYKNAVNSPLYVLFAAVECIRKHYQIEKVYIVKSEPDGNVMYSLYI